MNNQVISGMYVKYHGGAQGLRIYKHRNPIAFPHCYEMYVTNGLGYEQINHHEDTPEGLIRHLGEMDLRVMEKDSETLLLQRFDYFYSLLALEDEFRWLESRYEADMLKFLGMQKDIESRLDGMLKMFHPDPEHKPGKPPMKKKGLFSFLRKS
jgi:hypothetical protein